VDPAMGLRKIGPIDAMEAFFPLEGGTIRQSDLPGRWNLPRHSY